MYNPANGHMCFSEALAYLKRGLPIARASWLPGAQLHRLGKAFYLTHESRPENLLYHDLSSIDVLAEDWIAPVHANTQLL